VVASAGFTLMGECVYLRKPLLAVPLERQFEQVLNARYLEREGYGMAAERGVDADTLQAFVNSTPAYREALERYEQDGNAKLFAALDEYLDKVAAGLVELHPGRGSIDAAKERFRKIF
jgi:UDP:flavonoid glycosyltransferase YjiC (YdhE family)